MPLREISINVPRDGSPQQQSLRKKATVEALATSLFSPRGRGSIVDAVSALIEARGGEESPTSSGRVTPADASKAASASPAKSLGSPFASAPASPASPPSYVPYDPLMASGGRAGRASPRTSFASELSSRLDEAAAGTARADRRRQAHILLPFLIAATVGAAYVARPLFADASPPPPLSRAVVPFAGWEVDACGYANAPPTFLALPAPLRCAFRWKSFSCSEGCTFKVSSFLRRGRLCTSSSSAAKTATAAKPKAKGKKGKAGGWAAAGVFAWALVHLY